MGERKKVRMVRGTEFLVNFAREVAFRRKYSKLKVYNSGK